jgi:hypothetical protein
MGLKGECEVEQTGSEEGPVVRFCEKVMNIWYLW